MALKELITLLRRKDDAGDEHLLYPITKLECVDGAEEALDAKAPIDNPVFSGTIKVGEEEVAMKKDIDDAMAGLNQIIASDDGTGIITLSFGQFDQASEVLF